MKKYILLIIFICLITNTKFTHSKYILNTYKNIIVNTEEFYFDIDIENTMKNRFDLYIRNYKDNLYTTSDIKYKIYTNNNYVFSINNSTYNNTFDRVIEGNKKSIDNLSININNNNIKFIIEVYEPYTKIYSFEI